MLTSVLVGWIIGLTITVWAIAYRLGKVENSYNWRIATLEDALSALSMAHDETVQVTRATDDKFVELSEKIENIDVDVLDGTICCQFVTAEIEKTIPDNGEDYVDRKIEEFSDRVETIESKIETIASSFRCLGSDLE